MSWKLRSTSLCRRAITGELFKNSNFAMKARQQSSDCCKGTKSLMDECPVPMGSWSANYKRRDAKETKLLAVGVVSFLITMSVVQKKGLAKGHPEISLFF